MMMMIGGGVDDDFPFVDDDVDVGDRWFDLVSVSHCLHRINLCEVLIPDCQEVE